MPASLKSTTMRSTMEMSIDRGDPMSLHDQVAAEILGVNRNTVLRALRILRDEGTVDFTRGRGVRVTGTPQRSAVIAKLSELVDFARHQGYRRDDLVTLLQDLP